MRGGRDVRHAMAMLIPEAADADPELDEDVRTFYRYHSTLLEPWDGPAGVVFTDGRVVGAALDRNGLRPLRYAVADDRLVTCASEAGALSLPEGARIRRGRLGPGDMLVVDPALGIEDDHDDQATALSQAAVRALATRKRPRARPRRTGGTADGQPDPSPGGCGLHPRGHLPPPPSVGGHRSRADLVDGRRHRTAPAGRSCASGHVLSAPALRAGHEPGRSTICGSDRVMSLRTFLGARVPLAGEHPRAARLLELESFFLFPGAVDESWPRLDLSFDPSEGLRRGCERLAAVGRRRDPRSREQRDRRSRRCSRSEPFTSGSSRRVVGLARRSSW